ncbi:dihydrofolate reductase-like [Styela clava]
MSLKIHSIVACCKNEGIGYKGTLPWRLKKEMKHFRKITKGNPPEGKQNVIVMGRKTWQSLPGALPGRYNFVLSRTVSEKAEKMDGVSKSLEDFLKLITSDEWSSKIHEVFCIGGAEIYKQLFESSVCGKVILTRVLADYECDVFLPKLDGFKKIIENNEDIPGEEQTEVDGTKWMVEVYEKV